MSPPTVTLYYFDSIDGSQFWVRNWFATRDEADKYRTRLIEEDEYDPDLNIDEGHRLGPVLGVTIDLTPLGLLQALQSLGDPNDI